MTHRGALRQPRPVLVAPDAFKGTLRASEVAAAIGRGLERGGLVPPDLMPVADGGEGTMEALLPALGGETRGARVSGPLGDPVQAGFALLGRRRRARSSRSRRRAGSTSCRRTERDAEAASTHGTGELILAAVAEGAEVVFVAAGGSATTDGGAGALEAIADGGGLRGARLVVLCDVRTAFEDAPARFGPQKGADAAAVRRLERRLDAARRRLGARPARRAATGAAGGLVRRAVGGARRRARAGRAVRPRHARRRAADARRARGHRRRGPPGRRRRSRARPRASSRPTRGRPACRATRSSGSAPLGLFERRIIDLQTVREAGTLAELERAGEDLARSGVL